MRVDRGVEDVGRDHAVEPEEPLLTALVVPRVEVEVALRLGDRDRVDHPGADLVADGGGVAEADLPAVRDRVGQGGGQVALGGLHGGGDADRRGLADGRPHLGQGAVHDLVDLRVAALAQAP